MEFHVMTLFPDMIEAGMRSSVIGRAIRQGTIRLHTVNIRDYTADRHKKTDDYPYGGGAGMVMQAQPVYDCFQAIRRGRPAMRVICFTPQGRPLDQRMVRELAQEEELALLCGHYEGIDERVLEEIVTDYVSLGDFVLTGGELPAMALMDAVARLVPGVLHNGLSAETETFSQDLLEYPQYSRPEVWRGRAVPPVLLSGDHKAVRDWRLEQAASRTRARRPDLYRRYEEAQSCIARLSRDKLLHMDMLEGLRRGTARPVCSGEDGILLLQENGSTAYLSDVSGEAAGRIWDAFAGSLQDGLFRFRLPRQMTVRSREAAEALRRFGWEMVCACVQAVYTRGVALPPDRRWESRVLPEELAETVAADYGGKDALPYVRERLRRGLVYGVFCGEDLAGFIGMHEEGSMGMLHVREDRRRQGIAAALEAAAVNRTLEAGWTPFAQIIEGNEASLNLQKKLGLALAARPIYWLRRAE